MSRFGFDTYEKRVRILLVLSLHLKIESHIGLKGIKLAKLGLSSKSSSDDITRLFKEQDGV